MSVGEALSRGGVEPGDVDEVVMGEVGQVGPMPTTRGEWPRGGDPVGRDRVNVNRLCGSGLQAVVSGAMQILTDQATSSSPAATSR